MKTQTGGCNVKISCSKAPWTTTSPRGDKMINKKEKRKEKQLRCTCMFDAYI